MKKYKLEQLFNEVDELKATLENDNKEYKELMNKLFEQFKESDEQETINEINDTDKQEINDTDKQETINDTDKQETVSEESEDEQLEEFEYNGKIYIKEGNLLYRKTKDGQKGTLYGKLRSNGEVKKMKLEEVVI
jgi:hypothetical protein